ncbi:ER lumen protein retaining receptor-domain-containing protein [Mycena rosella]|uniref:ER lumen protein retaining receptor-domain-containing protein n=1 Tax=Mycena rosella TaxID=1033263 RepID=A0AAD7DIX9_MYCRO|nr:ER lumen protein retaining receptor-domain-containing protein [Mycena rosella]
MNPFRLAGDLGHLASKCILIWSIHRNKSAEGISFLTQAMYALVFLTRYLDLGMHFVSIYNTVLKVVYILSAFYVLVLMRWIYPRTTESQMAWRAAAISLTVACSFSLLFNYHFNLPEILWSFSIALESVCVIPQLILLRQTTVPTVITSRYLLALGSYRALYILNWIWRYVFENIVDPIAVLCGLVQTAFYLDFAWVYYGRQRVKLRDGVLVDSEDFERGWIHRWLGSKDDFAPLEPLGGGVLPFDEEGALGGQIALPLDVEPQAPARDSNLQDTSTRR